MQRYLEPELMINEDQVAAYNEAHREWGIAGFLYLYKKYFNKEQGTLIDLGTGTGQYLIALKNKFPQLEIQGYDASSEMVQCARKNIKQAELDIAVHCCRIEEVDKTSDYVMSTNTLHHIPDPKIFWNKMRTISNNVFVMDLVRPLNRLLAKDIVETTAQSDSEMFKTDYFNSLLAAFTENELREQISGSKLNLSIEGDKTGLQVAVIYGKFL
jgi:2-polyprenyl-3-methyl-5-hydroxy-6-metoxy-1,4-benzoquinol methylase